MRFSVRKLQALVILGLLLALLTPLHHPSHYHHITDPPEVESARAPGGSALKTQGLRTDQANACPVCVHQRLLSQVWMDTVSVLPAPSVSRSSETETSTFLASSWHLPFGARAPPSC